MRTRSARRNAKARTATEGFAHPVDKAEQGGHDESVSRQTLIESGRISAQDFDEAAAMCETLFAFGEACAAERGLILVDTKYEIGRAPDGRLVFVDEIHTRTRLGTGTRRTMSSGCRWASNQEGWTRNTFEQPWPHGGSRVRGQCHL